MPSNTKPPHPPRLCHIMRSPDFNGYGFNLHTIKNKSGQFIGQVDAGSPAQKALLKEGDRIVEVNGVNIASENHKQVVNRIKLVPDETKLLVVDEQADKWYKEHNIVISSSLPEVVMGSSSKSRHSSTSSSEADVKETKPEDRRSVDSGSSAATSEASHRQGEESEDSKDEEPLQGKVSGPATASNEDGTSSSSEDNDDAEDTKSEKVLANGKHEESEVVKTEGSTLEAPKGDGEVKAPVVEITETPATDDEEESSSEEEENDDDEEDEDSSDTEEQKPAVEQVEKTVAVEKVVASTKEEIVSEKSSRSNSSASASSRESDKSPPNAPTMADKSPLSTPPSPPSSVGAPSPTPAYTFKNTDGLNMNMSAAQMREYLASKKKKDIRHSEIDVRKKYEIIQKL